MPPGTYVVVRYIADPVRDEPMNVGIVASGPAGAVFKTDPKTWGRIRSVDIHLDPDTIPFALSYLESLAAKPVVQLQPGGVQEIQPWEPGFCEALAVRLPERFALSEPLFIEYADEQFDSMATAASELVGRLVAPPPRRFAFEEKDPGAPFERIRRRLRSLIEQRKVEVNPPIQGGLSKRIREPDFYYRRADGTPVVVNVVKLDYRQLKSLSREADANAFILLDLDRGQNTHSIVLVEWPAEPTEEFLDALQSLQAVADEVRNAREEADAVAEQIALEAMAAPA